MKYKFYHGAKNKIDQFVIGNEFMTDDTIMQEGPGIYLTSSINDAMRYGQFIHEVQWSPKKRLPIKKTSYPMPHYYNFVAHFIKKSPDWKESAMNWDEDPQRGLHLAIDNIFESYETPKERFEQIWYDFYRNDPALYCKNMVRVGYDGFIIEKNNGVKHGIVFNPNTIKIIRVFSSDDLIKEAIDCLQKLSNKKVVFKTK